MYYRFLFLVGRLTEAEFNAKMILLENAQIVKLEERVSVRKEQLNEFLKAQKVGSMVLNGVRVTQSKSFRFEFNNDVVKASFFKALPTRYWWKMPNYSRIGEEMLKPDEDMNEKLLMKLKATEPKIVRKESIRVKAIEPNVKNVKNVKK